MIIDPCLVSISMIDRSHYRQLVDKSVCISLSLSFFLFLSPFVSSSISNRKFASLLIVDFSQSLLGVCCEFVVFELAK